MFKDFALRVRAKQLILEFEQVFQHCARCREKWLAIMSVDARVKKHRVAQSLSLNSIVGTPVENDKVYGDLDQQYLEFEAHFMASDARVVWTSLSQ